MIIGKVNRRAEGRIGVDQICLPFPPFYFGTVISLIIAAVSYTHLFMAAVMGYVFAQTLTVPMLALTTGAKNLAEGNMDQSLTVCSND